ncbi:MAG: hypothetical protein HPY63_00210 [Methanobacteriaceae archaeon]|uniref:Uncharacterized protein n=1 Tax=Methanothermobacter tenebrarum TaxID=680118 RepID=A0A328PFB3_9EURY|nr:hypothetical protein [Methanothermobacter tenebrarum]NPV63933.1 hypothetical protein [Methanobacteriaceae archaeon]RAO79112.1 hypothetical protein DPC56_04095 [Methanothermobacter tenebrarum]
MSKAFDIIMAGVISGIVAFTTQKLGVGGTALGAVLGSMLYQLLSHYLREPLENVKTQIVEDKIVFTIPLMIILIIEVINFLANFYWRSESIIYLLEGVTHWNLFRSMGLGLLIMGLYPLLRSDEIKKSHGYLLVFAGLLLLLRGFVDVNSSIVKLYSLIFYQFDVLISVIVITILLYVIAVILNESIIIITEDKQL